MKKLLLVYLVALPSILLAQPTLTFNPSDGAVNVSLTANITITSNEGLKTTGGVNLDDDNVDALIQLLDENMDPVSFAATINGPRTIITINPSANLLEQHTYTLIFEPVENNGGQETTQQIITFETGDFTDPTFTLAKAINNTGSQFTFRVNVNENATVYYVVDQDASTPSEAEIRAHENGDGDPAEAWGSFTVSAGVDTDELISGLDFTPPVKFNIYYFAEDEATPANTNGVAGRGIPLLRSSSIPAPSVGPDELDLVVNVDETVTTYYVVTTSSTAPSSSQIISGQNEGGSPAFVSGSFSVGTANTNITHTITGLDDLTTYYVHFVSLDGSGNETIVETESATTTDGTGPVVVTLSPADNNTLVDISTNTFTITFDENVSAINSPASGNDHRIRLFENGVMVEDIDRNDTGVGMDGSIVANGTSNVATITFVYDLLPDMDYHIIIGNQVFQDAALNPFLGFAASTDWNFKTSTTVINNLTSNICSGSFQSISNIVISETGPGDFNNGTGQTLVIGLTNSSEFVISNSGVTVSGLSADITSLAVSVGLTSLTVTYTVAGNTVADNITISGIKVYATGAASTVDFLRTGGNADQDGNNGTNGTSLSYGTINVGATAPSPPQLAASQDLIHCLGEDISGKTLEVVDQGAAVTYNWYRDAALSDLALSTANEVININSDLGLPSPATYHPTDDDYKFYLVAVSACQSAPPVQVVLEISGNPVADAGADKTGASAVCTGTQLTLGGNPTLAVPSSAGVYTYSWDYVEGTPEPDPLANPIYTVTNASTTAAALYNFEVTVTDVNGCFGTDIVTVEVKPTFNISLISPNSYTFTPNSPNQTLVASPGGGAFSGIGVVQSNAPSTYQFSPAIAHATDPNTLPKSFDIYYTITEDGCTRSNVHVATFTIANSFFASLEPEYCSAEYPDPNVDGVILRLDVNGHTNVEGRKTTWNNNERFSRGPYNTQWLPGNGYANGTYVRYNNEIYRCNGLLGLPCSGFNPPDVDGQWVFENILKVKFAGRIANYYEDYYGGNVVGTTITKLTSTYTVNTQTYNEYRFGTNANYNNCPTCNYAWPAAYLEFERPEDIRLILPVWFPSSYYYRGDLVTYLGNVFQCIAPTYTTATQPDLNPGVWANVTNSNYSNGQYFHKLEGGVFKSGFYVNGQYVQINRNPTVFFSGLANGQDVCEFNVLNVDNPSSSAGIIYDLTGNFSNQNLSQSFSVRLDGGSTFGDGGGTITNNIIKPGTATFDTKNAFINSTSGSQTLKNIEIQYQVNPGTSGSSGEPCYGSSSIVVQVVQNSSFDFDNNIVDPDGSVYCYTEPAKGLRSLVGGVVINGSSGTPNSVTYNGFGVNDLGNSLGAFRPGVAVDQVNPGTSVQQSIPVTAVYLDPNQCKSTRVRTFKVNPDISPSFTFGGRVNYCYEDIANAFTGHFEDFTANSATITSTGRYDFVFRDPGNTARVLQTVNSNNTSFTAQTFYDQIQNILTTNGFTAYLNQSANINIIYTETLNTPGKVCSESFSQPIAVNPPLTLDIFGLADGDILCRNDNSNVSQGSIVVFDGSVTGFGSFRLDDDANFSTINTALNSTVNTSGGKATINLLSAYNAATDPNDPRQVYLEYNYTAPGCTGPADVIKGFKISPPPALAFDFSAGGSPAAGEIFCYDAAPVQLKTIQNTNVTLTGDGVTDSGSGTGIGSFNPQLGYNTSISKGGTIGTQQNINVTARIVDGVGCANTAQVQYKVNPIPQASVVFSKKEFCYEDTPGLIEGQQVRSWFRIEYQGVTTPHTEFHGDINTPQSSVSFDPKQKFDLATDTYGASTLSPANFHVYYSVADADNCTVTLGPTLVSVANQIDVTIAGLDNNDIFCSNETNGEKVLTFNPFPVDASKREFTIDGDVETLTSDKFVFKPALLGGDYELQYVVFSGENNCSNTATVSVKVLPSPKAVFSPEPACVGELIDFNADGTSNLSSAVYTWTLVDVVKTGQSVQHQFPGTNLYGVKLKVAYPAFNNDPMLVCQDSLRLDQVVGAIPGTLNFDHFNVCEGDETSFTIQPDIPISQVRWTFGDGVDTGLGFSADQINAVANTHGTFQAPVHTYPGQQNYQVVVTGKTAEVFGGCELTETHFIDILKVWSPSTGDPYYDMSQLNGGNGFWVVEDPKGNSTWEFDVAAKARINTAEMAWVTGADIPYKAEDVSYVNSPCFDLSSFSRPVMSLKHWSDTETSDGAVVQYSRDGGLTWSRLGNVASGLEWYNRPTIASNPGQQTDLTSGWSDTEQRQWAIGKHTLDVIPQPRNHIRFRVAFSSFVNSENRDGFAFNNVVIEERNRTILVENFTNEAATANNAAFKNFRGIAFNPAELVKLQYHHAAAVTNSQPDDLHLANPVDQNARAAFYGVTNPVKAFIDGGFGQLSTNSTFESPALGTYFSLRSLVTSPVSINIDFLPENGPSLPELAQLNVKATVQATSELGAAGQYNVFIAIAEQSVDNQVYVLRKMLPNASGTPLTSLSATDPAQEITVSYDMRHVTRLPDGTFAPFAVIVFVQHLETKDVLQTVMRRDGTVSSNVVTGVETTFEDYIRVYPNPADEVLNIILPAPVKTETPVNIFDTFGRRVYSNVFQAGEHIQTLETKTLSAGVYLIQLSTPEGVIQKKAMVVHR